MRNIILATVGVMAIGAVASFSYLAGQLSKNGELETLKDVNKFTLKELEKTKYHLGELYQKTLGGH